MTYYFWLGNDAKPLTYLIDTAEWRMIVGSAKENRQARFEKEPTDMRPTGIAGLDRQDPIAVVYINP